MTNPRDDLMALANSLNEALSHYLNFSDIEAAKPARDALAQMLWGDKQTIIKALRLAASRSEPVDREAVARLAERFWRIHPKELQDKGITRKQFYEQEMLSLLRPSEPTELCDDEGCPHYGTKHVCIVRPAEPVEAEGVGEPKPAGWQRSLKYAHVPEWEQCSTSEATSHFDRSPYHDYRPFYTHPQKSPDTSAEEMREALLDATANLVGAASAYRKHAARHRSIGRAIADPFFTTRAGDLEKAAERAQAAIRQLPTSKD